MIDAAITSVEANRSVIRFCSSIAFALSCSSRAIARFISTALKFNKILQSRMSEPPKVISC
jgi:hypothetical protein